MIFNKILFEPFSVEDPSDNFVRLRDFVDSKNCLKMDSFQPSKLTEGFTEAMAKEAQEKLKLNKVSSTELFGKQRGCDILEVKIACLIIRFADDV